jgi:transposase
MGDKTYYLKNKELVNKRVKIRRKKLRKYIQDIKKKSKCCKCGEDKWYLLDFHHSSDKVKPISSTVRAGWSIKRIQEEINKCEVYCANCHRELHYLENKFTF